MDETHEKFRQWLQVARKVDPDSPLVKPNLTDEEYLKSQVSRGPPPWIYFGSEDVKKCPNSSKPNLWVDFADDNTLRIGVAFNNRGSVRQVKYLLEGYSKDVRENLLEHFKKGDGWTAEVLMKMKKSYSQSPKYDSKYTVKISELSNDDTVREFFAKVDSVLADYLALVALPKNDPNRMDKAGGVSVNLVTKKIPLNEEEFAEAFAFAHHTLEICLKVKSPAQNRREENAKIEVLRCRDRYCGEIYKIRDSRVCDKCGHDLKVVKITKKEYEEIFGELP